MRLVLATKLIDRLLGLHKSLQGKSYVLLLSPCKSIHTFGLSVNIDVAFVDREGIVLKAYRDVKPNVILSCRKAYATLERFSDEESSWLCEGETMDVKSKRIGG